MKRIIAFLFFTLSLNLSAAELTDSKDTQSLCENAASLLSKGKVSESFALFKPNWPIPAAEVDNLSYKTESQLEMISKRFGRSIGIDFIKTQEAGSSFLKHTYILKYENTSIRYICVFYKPRNTWLVNSIKWDDNTSQLFD